jgi:hypothetical protein
MLGTFQQSHLRIEVEASPEAIAQCLLEPKRLQRWYNGIIEISGLPERLEPGLTFKSWIGPIIISHYVEAARSDYLRVILSEGVDGFHEWYWGDGWVQSQLEGVSLLPLKLGQTLGLLRLRGTLATESQRTPFAS